MTFPITRQTKRTRIQEALAELERFGLRPNFDRHHRIWWIETSDLAFLFDTAALSKRKAYRFGLWFRWYERNKTRALGSIPNGVRAIEKIRRAWNDLKPLAPSVPIKPSTTGNAGGSYSTVPGHLAALNSFDLTR